MIEGMRVLIPALVAASVPLILTQAAPPPILIKGGTVVTVTKGTIENGELLLKDGRIEKVGKNLSPPDGASALAM